MHIFSDTLLLIIILDKKQKHRASHTHHPLTLTDSFTARTKQKNGSTQINENSEKSLLGRS